MIIVEGLDATGKSTLVERLSLVTTWPVQKSEGPEQYPGEILDRCDRYRTYPDEYIFDRHPVISQQIYGHFAKKTPIPPHYQLLLQARCPLVIYASAENKGEHLAKDYDTPEHLEMIKNKRDDMERMYLKLLSAHFPGFMVYKWQFMDTMVNSAAKHAGVTKI